MTAPVVGGDALADVLGSLRISMSWISRAELRAPFGLTKQADRGRAIFHAVTEGQCLIRVMPGEDYVELRTGDLALMCRGGAHHIADARETPTVPIESLPANGPGAEAAVVYGGKGERVTVVCGSFSLAQPAAAEMLGALPPLLVVRADSASAGVAAWLEQSLMLLRRELQAEEQGRSPLADRLTDVLVMHVLRACAEESDGAVGTWLAALRDDKIGRALAMIHREPGEGWSASSLASKVGMSRSSFFARFSDLVGEPPLKYLARWRMWVAADLLARPSLSLGELAEQVGYASEDAFARVFKRVMGISPARYRRELVA